MAQWQSCAILHDEYPPFVPSSSSLTLLLILARCSKDLPISDANHYLAKDTRHASLIDLLLAGAYASCCGSHTLTK